MSRTFAARHHCNITVEARRAAAARTFLYAQRVNGAVAGIPDVILFTNTHQLLVNFDGRRAGHVQLPAELADERQSQRAARLARHLYHLPQARTTVLHVATCTGHRPYSVHTRENS